METDLTWDSLLKSGVRILKDAGIEESHEDARALFLECFGTDQAGLLLHRQRTPEEKQVRQFYQWIGKRSQGCPVQYITGTQCFMGLEFAVGPQVLIPRMDTETLVDTMLRELPPTPDLVLGADLCTGCGCIALSLAKLGPPNLMLLATDLSEQALKVARENARRIAPDCLPQFYQGDLFQALPLQYKGLLDFVAANPPYIPTDEIGSLDVNIKDYEPRMALDGGRDGLSFYRRISVGAQKYLKRADGCIWKSGASREALLRGF